MIMIISGCEVLIDDEDYEMIFSKKYFLKKASLKRDGKTYFSRNTVLENGNKYTALLHRDIMDCIRNDGKVVDHINGNTLDNRKINLRLCTNDENLRNRKINKNCKSGVKGVRWHKSSKKWLAQISYNREMMYLGSFDDINDAALAYSEASKKYHGAYGRVE